MVTAPSLKRSFSKQKVTDALTKKPSETLIPKKGPIKLMKSGILGDDTESLFSSTSVLGNQQSDAPVKKFAQSKILSSGKPETPIGGLVRTSTSSNVY